ncbi:MAG: TonB-dependent receptor [Bacteroidota bacterium]|nr:TonB-dependent receptor [Bacteroidota bacterium]
MRKTLLLNLFFLFFSIFSSAQELQSLRGRILNDLTQQPVNAALISIKGPAEYSAVSDSSGHYQIQALPGTYTLSVQHTSYRLLVEENVIIHSGKQRVNDLNLKEYKLDLAEVSTSASGTEGEEVNEWELHHLAAVFYDPARAVNTHSGLVNTDDQANNISVRGTSPNYMQWKLEGVEVVNPNHLENAGTINDKPSLNGGGVSMISAQLLNSSDFNLAPFGSVNGNTLSGMMDLQLRRGNDQRSERIIQASLLGTDVCLEGPFSKKSSASYLVNARYSTVGLLSSLGVNFGNERINYKDISFHVSLPYSKGSLALFGIAGDSESIFRGMKDSSEVKFSKDQHDIDYHSFTAIAGISNVVSLSGTVFLKSVITFSKKEVRRSSISSNNNLWLMPEENDRYDQEKLSSLNYVSKSLGASYRLKAGAYLNYFSDRIHNQMNKLELQRGTVYMSLLQPFIDLEGRLTKRLEFQAGIHSLIVPGHTDLLLLPSAMLKYRISSYQSLSIRAGESAKIQPAALYVSHRNNRTLQPTTSRSIALSQDWKKKKYGISTEVYYQLYEDIPVNLSNGFSGFNYFNEPVNFELQQSGSAWVQGVDLTVERRVTSNYILLSGNIYRSEYTVGSHTADARFNTGYALAVAAGKEYAMKNKKDVLGIDLRSVARNGFKEARQDDPFVYDRQLPFYSRIDFRISYKRNKKRSTVIWALDIQNLLNTKNVAYHYTDDFTEREETRYQLGLIPVLSYKVLF